jgi:hypothetical protein
MTETNHSSPRSKERGQEDRASEPEQFVSDSARRSGGQAGMTSDQPTREEIAARAYQHWETRGGVHGAPDEDWHRAEQELRAEKATYRQEARSATASTS